MSQHVEPYLFKPLMTSEELENHQERIRNVEKRQREGHSELSETRIGHNRWCTCGKCSSMATEKESICCKEVWEITLKMETHVCITDHPSFERVCLDPEVLQTALVAMREVRFEDYQVPVPQRTFRLAAYRQFTWWIHTQLGRSVRRVIPACVVAYIRQQYPEESGQYTGFLDVED